MGLTELGGAPQALRSSVLVGCRISCLNSVLVYQSVIDYKLRLGGCSSVFFPLPLPLLLDLPPRTDIFPLHQQSRPLCVLFQQPRSGREYHVVMVLFEILVNWSPRRRLNLKTFRSVVNLTSISSVYGTTMVRKCVYPGN